MIFLTGTFNMNLKKGTVHIIRTFDLSLIKNNYPCNWKHLIDMSHELLFLTRQDLTLKKSHI